MTAADLLPTTITGTYRTPLATMIEGIAKGGERVTVRFADNGFREIVRVNGIKAELPIEGCHVCGWEDYTPICPSCANDA